MDEKRNGYIGKVIFSGRGNVKIRHYRDRMGINTKNRRINNYRDDNNQNRIISLRSRTRTRQGIFEIINNNIDSFESLITLTFRDEVDDYDVACSYMKKYIKNIRRNMPEGEKLIYLVVPEIQEERSKKVGKNIIHFHMLTNIRVGSGLIPERETKRNNSYIKGRWYGLKYYDLKYWNYGYSSAIKVDNNVIGLANYLSKYLSKGDNSFLFGRRKYIASQNIKRNTEYKIVEQEELDQMIEDYRPYLKDVYTHIPKKRYLPIYTEYEYEIVNN